MTSEVGLCRQEARDEFAVLRTESYETLHRFNGSRLRKFPHRLEPSFFRTRITGEDHVLFEGSMTPSSSISSTCCCSSSRCLNADGYGCWCIGLTSCVVILCDRSLQCPQSLELPVKHCWCANSTEWIASCWSCGSSLFTLALICEVMSGLPVTKATVFISAVHNSSIVATHKGLVLVGQVSHHYLVQRRNDGVPEADSFLE